MTSINYSVLSKINMLNIEDRTKQLRLNHVFNIYHDYAPQYLHQNFIKVSVMFTTLEEVPIISLFRPLLLKAVILL